MTANPVQILLRLHSICIAYANDFVFATAFGNVEEKKRHFNRSSHQLFSVSRLLNCVLFFNVILSSNLTAVLGRVNYKHFYIEIFYTHNIKREKSLKNAWPIAKAHKRTNESLSKWLCSDQL